MELDPVTAILLLALLLAVFGWWRASTRIARGNRRRQVRAAIGEHNAESLLARFGYTVDDRQVTVRWCMHIDGEPTEVSSRADLLVSQWRRTYVAEVKTGDKAPDPTRPATRRQLMEYLHAFDVDGVLLVDMERGEVVEVAF